MAAPRILTTAAAQTGVRSACGCVPLQMRGPRPALRAAIRTRPAPNPASTRWPTSSNKAQRGGSAPKLSWRISSTSIYSTPATRSMPFGGDRAMLRDRKFADSPLEETVSSELVSGSGNSLLPGKIQGIHRIWGPDRAQSRRKPPLHQYVRQQITLSRITGKILRLTGNFIA